MTLAQFKRDTQKGYSIELKEFYDIKDGEKINRGVADRIKGIRYINDKDTTGLYLKQINDNSNARGSFLGYPKASELDYTDEHIIINDGFVEMHYELLPF